MGGDLPALPVQRGWQFPLRTIDRYLLRQLFTPFLLIELGVVLFLELERALRLVYDLSVAGADLQYFFPLLAALTPYFISFALPIAFFVALVLLLARLDDDLELQAMLANGMSLARIARPLVLAGFLVAGIAVLTNGWLEPLGRYDFRALRVEAITSGRTARVVPGAFFVPSDNLMIMVAPADTGRSRPVFVWHRDRDGKQQMIVAQNAAFSLSRDGKAMNLTLVEGSILADDPRPGYKATHPLDFRRIFLSLPILDGEVGWQRGRDERELTLPELIDPGAERLGRIGRDAIEAELFGRIGKAALIPLLPLLLLPLIMAARRGHRTPGGIIAATLFIIALQSVNMVRQRAAAGQIEALPNVAMIVGGFALLQVGLMIAGRNLPSHSPMSVALKWMNGLIPALKFPKPVGLLLPNHILASYLGVQAMVWTLLSLGILVVLATMSEIFLVGGLFVQRGMGTADVFQYGFLRAPAHALQALSLAALLGPTIAFFLLVRHRELLTFRLMGISQLRLMAMLLPVPISLSLMTYALAEYAVPQSQQTFQRWWQNGGGDEGERRGYWFSLPSTLVRVADTAADGRQLKDVLIVRLEPTGAIAETIAAVRATATPAGWQLEDAVHQVMADGLASRSRRASERWKIPVSPADILVMATSGTSYSANWARRALAGDAPASLGDPAYHTRIWRSASLLLLPILMVLFALPIATTSPTGNGRRLAVGYAIVAGALFLVADSLMSLMAMMGMVPIIVGIWAMPLLALTVATAVTIYWER